MKKRELLLIENKILKLLIKNDVAVILKNVSITKDCVVKIEVESVYSIKTITMFYSTVNGADVLELSGFYDSIELLNILRFIKEVKEYLTVSLVLNAIN